MRAGKLMNKQYSYPLDLSWTLKNLLQCFLLMMLKLPMKAEAEATKVLDSYKGIQTVRLHRTRNDWVEN